MNHKKINVAIDGPSSAGKSTVSEEIAKRLGYTFLSSGSIYRAIAYVLIKNKINHTDENAVSDCLNNEFLKISLDNQQKIYVDGEDITRSIRSNEVSKVSSEIAIYKAVRQYVVEFIQHMTKSSKGFIMDGRDTTYKIMPYAELKVYLDATPHERARRRYLQNIELGFNTSYEEVLDAVKTRDDQDFNRANDPLKRVDDASYIDCTNMTFSEVVNEIIRQIEEIINAQ
ncbi:cytidylate kinase [Mycoplasmopsis californica HAZ160_1]|uniref:Cytidylate kinase n=2 Tax=Mycoplasmopsis californica TaxID=2113 RepID=A0A059XRS5_9BACT|nr:(d)CMP kinase [Mycoplasmopsis californica]AIA29730.1 cytidylate kinase [Mycoplasmopsis californica]BAP00824.1 cytidylate kinase [Mycoplasmopsis californica HAZ160_1]BBG40680.1 cytidylate kinase [Mycoplasmopsis californica]BBG41275.1 cytidylate kinase [Mycoplasmopsis californica]BBG41868.1 cytidylate kinase [Mycoplasmopsis californica]